ncbi:hypothetical protein BSKO_10099 [Bryopsis sp. KO-2023]|nr:hypothetical protein BSKO_10099 [Bryopsis sp. KO-2023]
MTASVASPLVVLLCVQLLACTAAISNVESLLGAAKKIEPWIVAQRRELHKIPELQYELPKTSAFLRKTLDDLQIPYRYPVAETGIVATIGKGTPIVALRADMDGLPIQEPEGLPYVSMIPGHMHACGHDAHMSMLLGAAKLLKEREAELKGTVRLVFQPAEEGRAGGEKMVQQGAVEGVSAMFGFHVWPELPSGVVGSRQGTITAGTNAFILKVTGRGGHGAMPHLNVDPWPAVAQMITAFQTLVSRETPPVESNVVTIAKVDGGGAFNVIPSDVTISGTMRSLQATGIDMLEERMTEMSKGIASAFRCEAASSYSSRYPPTINDKGAYEFAMKVAQGLFGESSTVDVPPSLVGEDFAYYGQKVPAALLLLGINNQTAGSTAMLHTTNFILDESVLHRGAAYHTALAIASLETHQKDMNSAKKEEL